MNVSLTRHVREGKTYIKINQTMVLGLGRHVHSAISFFSYMDQFDLYLDELEDFGDISRALYRKGVFIEIKDSPNPLPKKLSRVNC